MGNRVPFNYILNACRVGTLRRQADKWYRMNEDKKKRWVANFMPQYKRYMDYRKGVFEVEIEVIEGVIIEGLEVD